MSDHDPPCECMLPWAHVSQPPNGISIGSVVFARLTNVNNRQTDRHTDRPRYYACIACNNQPLTPAIAAILPNNNNNNNNYTAFGKAHSSATPN